MNIGAFTDKGVVRALNEDCYFVSDSRYMYGMVADGMGGHQAGEVASGMTCDIIRNEISAGFYDGMDCTEAADIIKRAFIEANSAVYSYAVTHSKMMGMGTTATLAMIYDDKIIVAHVGDSRVYSVGATSIRQITRDHSYVEELLARGEITPEIAKTHPKKNYITRAMGTEETIKVDVEIFNYYGEVIVICSDGLTNMVDEETICAMVNKYKKDLQTAAEQLVQAANDNGGADNITVVALCD
jgi:protein phosphatase